MYIRSFPSLSNHLNIVTLIINKEHMVICTEVCLGRVNGYDELG